MFLSLLINVDPSKCCLFAKIKYSRPNDVVMKFELDFVGNTNTKYVFLSIYNISKC